MKEGGGNPSGDAVFLTEILEQNWVLGAIDIRDGVRVWKLQRGDAGPGTRNQGKRNFDVAKTL